MRIAEYLRHTGADITDMPDVVFTCTCEWFPPPYGNRRPILWDAGCPVHDEDPLEW